MKIAHRQQQQAHWQQQKQHTQLIETVKPQNVCGQKKSAKTEQKKKSEKKHIGGKKANVI